MMILWFQKCDRWSSEASHNGMETDTLMESNDEQGYRSLRANGSYSGAEGGAEGVPRPRGVEQWSSTEDDEMLDVSIDHSGGFDYSDGLTDKSQGRN